MQKKDVIMYILYLKNISYILYILLHINVNQLIEFIKWLMSSTKIERIQINFLGGTIIDQQMM